MNVAAIAVYTSYIEGTIGAGSYGGACTSQTFFFYKGALLLSIQISSEIWEDISGLRHQDNLAQLEITLAENSPYLVSSFRKDKMIFNVHNDFIHADMYRNVPANTLITVGGSLYEASITGKALTGRIYFDLFYTIQ